MAYKKLIFKKLMLLLCGSLGLSILALGGTCCHTPTVWTFKNQDKLPVRLQCKLEKSSAWSGKPIMMTTGDIAAGAVYKHTWDSGWYSDGMGMIPGQWVCRVPTDKETKNEANKVAGVESAGATVVFSTDWGENVTISWAHSKATVARASLK